MDKIFRLHSYYFPPEITNKILFEHKGLCHPTAKIIKEEVNIFKQNILNIWSNIQGFKDEKNKWVNEGIDNFFDGEQNYYNISSYVFNLKTKKSRGRTGDIMKNEIDNWESRRLCCHKVPEGGVERVFVYSEYDDEHKYRWVWGDLQSMVMNY